MNRLPPRCASLFQIEAELAPGGWGQVFRAQQVGLRRPVLLKLLRPELLASRGAIDRFVREARLTASISHPGVVIVLDHDVECGLPWIAYEYLDGPDLRTLLKTAGRLELAAAMNVASQVAAALEAVHQHGVVHRDIKPENIIQSATGNFKLADFGIARDLSDAAWRTTQGAFLGTAAYCAPEQAVCSQVTHQADLYALGIVLFEMLTGHPPFAGPAVWQVLEHHQTTPPPVPGALVEGIPAALDALVLRLLAKSTEDRYQSASAVVKDLAAINPGKPIPVGRGRGSTRNGSPRKAGHRTTLRSRQWPAAAAAILGLGIGVLAIAGLLFRAEARHLMVARSSPERSPDPSPVASASVTAQRLMAWPAWAARVECLGPVGVPTWWAREAPLDLGGDPAAWRFWVRLGEWLASSGREPPPRPAADPLGLEGWMALRRYLESPRYREERFLASQAVLAVRSNGQDGRSWLVLGRLLEQEGQPAAARRAYQRALDLEVKPAELDNVDPLVWAGLARAIGLLRPALLLDWYRGLPPEPDQVHAWRGLIDAWFATDPDRVKQVFDRAIREAADGEPASAFLGEFLLHVDGQRAAATAILKSGLQRNPGSERLRSLVLWDALVHGSVEELSPDSLHLPQGDWRRQLLQCAARGPGAGSLLPKNWMPGTGAEAMVEAEAFRLLEAGETQQAGDLIARGLVALGKFPRDELCLELAAAGLAAPWLTGWLQEVMIIRPIRDGAWLPWYRAAGILTTTAGIPLWNSLEDAVRARLPRTGIVLLNRALWLSRQHRHRDALDALEAARALGLTSALARLPVTEILLRVLMSATTHRPDPDLRRRAVACIDMLEGDARALLQAAAAERCEDVAAFAQVQWETHPFDPIWGLAEVWDARRRGEPQKERAWARRLTVSVRYRCDGLWVLHELARP